MPIAPRAGRIGRHLATPTLVFVVLLGSLGGWTGGIVPAGASLRAPLSPDSAVVHVAAGPAARPSTFSPVWSRLPVAAPSPRSYYGSAWDPEIDGLLMFGGCVGGVPWGESTYCSTMTNETWAFVSGAWENLTGPVGPSPRLLPMMAYDPTEDGVLLFGGGTGPANSQCATDTWLYDASGWTELYPSTVPGCAQTGMDFDGNLGHVLLLASASGTDDSATENVSWEFANGTWVQLAATSSFDRSNPMMIYDSTDRETVLFGGFDLSCGCQNLDDTWVFRQGAWTEIYPAQSPGARNEAAITDDPGLGGVLMWGGHYAYTYYNDTWLFQNGSWNQLNTPVAPDYEWAMQMVTDPANDQVILFGGYNFTNSDPAFSNETWIYAYPSPFTAATLTIEPPTITLDQETALYAGTSGGLGQLTYAYFGLPAGCSSTNSSYLLCIPGTTGQFEIQVNVTDQIGRFITAVATLTVNPAVVAAPLTLSEFLADPSTVTAGEPLTLTLVTTGGAGSNTYVFSGLPGGCLTIDAPSLTCDPSGLGTFDVSGTVQDSQGNSVEGHATVTVDGAPPPAPGPTVLGLAAFPNPATVGKPMAFEVQTTGGVDPLSFAYTGLPAGCSTSNSSAVFCTPTTVGSSQVTVSVTDALGRASDGNTTAVVAAAPTPTGTGSSPANPWGPSVDGIPDIGLALGALAVAVGAVGVAILVNSRSRRPPTGPGPSASN
jgi:hypothetical protein